MNEDTFCRINVHVLHGNFIYEVTIIIDLVCNYDRVTFKSFNLIIQVILFKIMFYSVLFDTSIIYYLFYLYNYCTCRLSVGWCLYMVFYKHE